MALIAKRKVGETWRAAVAARLRDGSDDPPAGLAAFDEVLAQGGSEAEAAFSTLAQAGRLWHVIGPDQPPALPAASEAADPHRLPNV